MGAVTLEGLRVTYDDQVAVDGVSLGVEAGELFVVLGPSGCGKTTMLRAIAGLERVAGGSIGLGDRTVSGGETHVAPSERKVGFVHQDLALWPHMTALQQVVFVQTAGDAARKTFRGEEALDDLGILHLASRRPEELSGGERQRLALARALVTEPSLLLLDEPLSSLDPATARDIRALLARINRERGITMIYVTHLQEEAFELATRIAVLRRGRLQQLGSPEDVAERPANAFVAGFVGSSNVVDGELADGRFRCALGEFSANGAGSSTAVFREHDLAVTENGDIDAVVVASHYRGAHYTSRVSVGGVEVSCRDHVRRTVGDAVRVDYSGDPWFLDGMEEEA